MKPERNDYINYLVLDIVHLMTDKSAVIDSKTHFNNFVINNINSAELLSRLSNEKYVKDSIGIISKVDAKSAKQRLFRDIKNIEQKRKKRKILIYKSCSIAAAVLFISLLIYNLPKDKFSKSNNILSYNGINTISKPTLILSDGNKITLESNNNDRGNIILANDKMTIKTESNIVKYEIKEQKEDVAVTDTKVEYNTLVVPKRCQFSILLADGTEVIVNAGSEFTHPMTFTGDTREVYLKGEAYFNVAKSDKQFIVNTDNANVKVHGTKFNVRAGDFFESTLLEGSVGVDIKLKDSICEVKMKPNQHFILDNNQNYQLMNRDNSEMYIAWLDNMFAYDKEPLMKVVENLSMWYGVDIDFTKSVVDNIYISLSVSRDIELLELFKAIEKISDVKFVREGGENFVIVRK